MSPPRFNTLRQAYNFPEKSVILVMSVEMSLILLIFFFLQDRGQKITEGMRQLEKETMKKMENFLAEGTEEPAVLVNLFSSSVQKEISVYSKS